MRYPFAGRLLITMGGLFVTAFVAAIINDRTVRKERAALTSHEELAHLFDEPCSIIQT